MFCQIICLLQSQFSEQVLWILSKKLCRWKKTWSCYFTTLNTIAPWGAFTVHVPLDYLASNCHRPMLVRGLNQPVVFQLLKLQYFIMLHYALGMDFPIHTRNTWKILILLYYNFYWKSNKNWWFFLCNI